MNLIDSLPSEIINIFFGGGIHSKHFSFSFSTSPGNSYMLVFALDKMNETPKFKCLIKNYAFFKCKAWMLFIIKK
jgi:hypothetical protein